MVLGRRGLRQRARFAGPVVPSSFPRPRFPVRVGQPRSDSQREAGKLPSPTLWPRSPRPPASQGSQPRLGPARSRLRIRSDVIAVYGCTAPAQALQATGSAAAVLPFSPVSTRACSGVGVPRGQGGMPSEHV